MKGGMAARSLVYAAVYVELEKSVFRRRDVGQAALVSSVCWMVAVDTEAAVEAHDPLLQMADLTAVETAVRGLSPSLVDLNADIEEQVVSVARLVTRVGHVDNLTALACWAVRWQSWMHRQSWRHHLAR